MNEEQALVILMDYRKSINSQGFEPGREEVDEALGVAIFALRSHLSKKFNSNSAMVSRSFLNQLPPKVKMEIK